ncbi:hypothetical protein Taro_053927, partial [Colocasia esculenta]|nr:hypothetical protein [Colocasia esculenta]
GVIVELGARSRWPFRREGPNGSALLLEDSVVESFTELSWLVWDAEVVSSPSRHRPASPFLTASLFAVSKPLREARRGTVVRPDYGGYCCFTLCSCLTLTRHGGETSQKRQGARRVEETGRSVGDDSENRVLDLGRGSGSRGRYSWHRQARELIEQHNESDMPAPGQVQEEVSVEEFVAQPHGAAAAGSSGRSVPPPAVPEQQVDPEVEQPTVQQASGTGSTRAGQRRTAITEDRTTLLERFLHLRLPMFFGEYDPDKAESWTHELEHTFETKE